jgi:RNA polymerase sigma-54 factor
LRKYAHTPHGVVELRSFFGEAAAGPEGSAIPLRALKAMVEKIIKDENRAKPLKDEQIALQLRTKGFEVSRRSVAKYREDLNIPPSHQRRLAGSKK